MGFDKANPSLGPGGRQVRLEWPLLTLSFSNELLPTWIGRLCRPAVEGVRWEVKVRSEISRCRWHSGRPPQNITCRQTRISTNGTTERAGRMGGTISHHIADYLSARMRFGVVRCCMPSVMVAGLNAVRRSD